MARVIGWDLGGANIKLASIEDGRVASVAQISCPIIAERRKFDAAIEAALPLIALPASHAVTMTGELSDVFSDRPEGVAYLVDGALWRQAQAVDADHRAAVHRRAAHAETRLLGLAVQPVPQQSRREEHLQRRDRGRGKAAVEHDDDDFERLDGVHRLDSARARQDCKAPLGSLRTPSSAR